MGEVRMRPRKYLLPAAVLTAVLLAASGACPGGGYSGPPEAITIGSLRDLTSAPAVVADARGFFAANGLEVKFQRFETGAQGSDALLRAEVNVAYMAEYVMARNALNQQPIRVIACDSKYEGVVLAARKSLGIENIAALKGKTIGVAMQTVNLFYLSRLLERNGLSLQDVNLLDGRQPEFVELFNRGEIHVVVFSQYWVSQLNVQPGDGLLVVPAQGNQEGFRLAASRKEWVEQHPDLVQRYLRAISQAEDHIASQPEEAKAIMEGRFELNRQYLESEWPAAHFGLSLDLSLLAAMNDEARWMIANGLTGAKEVPDMANYIYLDGLRSIKPEAVNINR